MELSASEVEFAGTPTIVSFNGSGAPPGQMLYIVIGNSLRGPVGVGSTTASSSGTFAFAWGFPANTNVVQEGADWYSAINDWVVWVQYGSRVWLPGQGTQSNEVHLYQNAVGATGFTFAGGLPETVPSAATQISAATGIAESANQGGVGSIVAGIGNVPVYTAGDTTTITATSGATPIPVVTTPPVVTSPPVAPSSPGAIATPIVVTSPSIPAKAPGGGTTTIGGTPVVTQVTPPAGAITAAQVAAAEAAIVTLQGELAVAEAAVPPNPTEVLTLAGELTTAQSNFTTLQAEFEAQQYLRSTTIGGTTTPGGTSTPTGGQSTIGTTTPSGGTTPGGTTTPIPTGTGTVSKTGAILILGGGLLVLASMLKGGKR